MKQASRQRFVGPGQEQFANTVLLNTSDSFDEQKDGLPTLKAYAADFADLNAAAIGLMKTNQKIVKSR